MMLILLDDYGGIDESDVIEFDSMLMLTLMTMMLMLLILMLIDIDIDVGVYQGVYFILGSDNVEMLTEVFDHEEIKTYSTGTSSWTSRINGLLGTHGLLGTRTSRNTDF